VTPSISLPPLVVAYVTGGEGGANTSLRSVWLRVPSVKLALHLAFVGTPDDGSPGLGFDAAATWQLTPYVPAADARGVRPAPLGNVFRECSGGTDTPQPLPGGYEIQSSVRLWRARLTLKAGDFSYTDDDGAIVNVTGIGKVVASCTIEPAPEACITDAEFRSLASQCEMWMDGEPAALTI
jgi:hypothetical protein